MTEGDCDTVGGVATGLDVGRDTVGRLSSAVGDAVVAVGTGGGGERALAGVRFVTGIADGVSDKLAEVPCEPWDGGGMAVREFGVSLSGRGGAVQL